MKTEQELKDALEDIFFDALTDKSNPPYYTDKVDPENDGYWQWKVYELCADELIKRGYGDVSEYKAEREMLGSQIKVLKQRLNNKYIEIEQLKAENEKLKTKCDDLKRLSDWQREEIKMLKAEVNKGCDNCETIKQGQVDVLKELKTRHDYAIKNMGYPWDISQQIDELIKEIEK